MKRNQGFTFIELMITVTIMTLLIAGGVIFMSRFGASQKIESAKLELLSSLRLARNYAMTKQLVNEDDPELIYVSVSLTQDGVISAHINSDLNRAYFSKDISANNISVTASNLWFSVFNGKLVKDDGTGKIIPVSDSEKVVIEISSNEGVDTTETIEISSLGLIDEK